MKTNYSSALENAKKAVSRLTKSMIVLLLLATSANVFSQCPTPPGDPSVYGNNSWIGYVYSGLDTNNPPQNAFTTTVYRGYVTQAEQFNWDLANAAPTASTVCGSYADSFSIRYRMQKNFSPGYYYITLGGDDGVRLSVDGGATWAISDWNYHSYQTVSGTIYLDGTKDLVLESYDQGGQYHVSFSYSACLGFSTAPTSISGTNAICAGTSTTLTAQGGTMGGSSTYQWGTGNTVGNNVIAGQTGASITVSPTTTTTYWVRRQDPAPCNINTPGVTQEVTVTPVSTAPTGISGTTTLCAGSSTTLTATGGTLGSGSTYEWGTGTVGSNVIAGQTAVSITVTPLTTTTYWVRRVNPGTCGTTNAVTTTVNVTAVAGDQVSYGNGAWIGYVYTSIDSANPPVNAFGTTYRGTVGQPEQFDYNLGTTAMSSATMCGTYDTNYAIRFKMNKTWTAGYYTFTVGGDDGYRFSMDGGATWTLSNWSDHGYATSTSAQIYMSGSKDFVIEYYERGGDSRVSFSYVACTDVSTAPTSISGTTSICNGTSTTLTATGGYAGAYATYQWGTGTTVGNNTINGQTGVSITVSPTGNTTYWVRRTDGTPCNLTTTGVTQLVTVTQPSTAPTGISGTTTTCGASTTLTATGGTLVTGSVYEWGTGTVGQNIIAGQTGVSITVTPATTTTYWVRRTGPAPCNTATNAFSVTVTVSPASTAPTSITGNNSLCSVGTTGLTLTANGGTAASGSTYQWGTGSVVGTNPIGGQTNQTIYIQPTATTTYWVRRYDSSCNTYTTGVTVVVYRGSTGPYSISGNGTVCANQATTLYAQNGTLATGSSYQWGTGNIGGANVIAGATGASISVTPTAQTTYWVRIVDTGSCPGTDAVFYTLNTYTPATPVTSITGPTALCSGAGGGNLTANGATLGSNAAYQWGTGTVGQNVFANYNPVYINPTTTTTYWVRTYDATCNVYTTAQTFTVTVNTPSTQPTGINGTTTICNGGSTTLTATGGTVGTGATYAWGTGYTVGQNVISGQTGVSITVSPTAQTVYWVQRIDPAPCNTQTQGPTVTVNVTAASTAPTSITGAPSASVCYGTSYTLTATGGTAASGSNYQWGTGATVGSNVIAGQTGASITVNPSVTTIYWVRRYDGAPCSAYTSAATTTVTITTPPGTPTAFGVNQWNAYGYATADITLATAVYAGYYVQTTLDFSTQTGTNSWNNQNSPSSSAGWNGCPVPNDNFTLVYKRMGFPCGTYTLSLPNWDDQAQVYINGTLVWSCNSYSGGGACSGTIPGSFNLTSTSYIEVRLREQGGGANIALSFVKTDVASSAPTTIAGANASCDGAAVTLTASGGTTGTNGAFQWGTGTVGSNIIAGATSASITVNPAATTTYWVRRIDSVCGFTTTAVTQTITVSGGSVSGSLSATATTICRGSNAGTITLSGQTGNVIKWQYAPDSSFTTGVVDIAFTGTTLTSAQIGQLTATRYFRAVVQNGLCNIAYTQPVAITILAAVTYNGTWSGTPTALTPVVISANLNITSNLNVCACQVTSGATVSVQNNATLIVQREIIVEESSNMTVESSASIVQVEDDAVNMGAFTVKRNSAPMKGFDFTYWSSPVQGITLYQMSPETRFDKYFSFNPVANQWITHLNGNAVMEPARGYTVRAPAGWSTTNATQGVYNAVFTGIANTGVVPVTIAKGTGTYNLIGNPYPSAIDIDKFITDPANAALVNGTIYLWAHNTAVSSLTPGNAQYNYAADDYAKYNLTGGVKTASSAITGGVEPTGKVASGQGFFIQAKSTLANGTYSATFRNAMRVANQNSQFFRNSAETQTADTPTEGLEKHRAWINITNTTGAYDEMLLGYIENATNEMDGLYDGPIFNGGNYVSLYSILGTDKLAIQGRALPFDVNDVIPLGYKTSIAGTLTIALEHFDGLFGSQIVYLLDKSDMSYHNLSEAAYSFTSATGIFDTRFELHFQAGQLGTGDHTPNENSVYIIKQDKHVEVSSGNYNMSSVEIFDLTGKKVYEKGAINSTLFSTRDLNIAAQVLIVKVTLESDVTVTKKIVMY
ncbi:MAG: T9SS sorting signal type C domain-containing protein [Flavobacterium sp.]|uniref:Ig-like domain-containing protein n=1 Tax=Flavobacterium sp. TaxID=239 RepID=UPI0011F8F74D|nr:T9SS sorting signal type C domain-containing protein [Flavobacterium sp.]RZJ68517.1 MAG: T9SS sorting signal type C domain-containing protein [Flavobacterium sp.]